MKGYWFWNIKSSENKLISPKFWTTLGYNPDKMISKPNAWKSTIISNNSKPNQDKLKSFNENHENAFDQILKFKHKNGNTVWLQLVGFYIT